MRVLIVIGCCLFSLHLTAAESVAECISARTAFFYVNGINQTPAGAELSRDALEATLNVALGPVDDTLDNIRCRVSVEPAYNTTVHILADLYESARRTGLVSDADGHRLLDILDHLTPLGVADPLGDFLFRRIAEGVRGVDFGNPTDLEARDLLSHVASYTAALDQGKRVVIFAHSQGNLFANEGYRRLRATLPVEELRRVSIVSIATPAAVVEPGDADPSPHTTLLEDPIHTIDDLFPQLSVLGPNTPDGRFCSAGLEIWIECHFLETYLESPLAKERIIRRTKRHLATEARADVFSMRQGTVLRIDSPGLLRNDEMIGVDRQTFVEFLPPVPMAVTNVGDGAFVVDLRSSPSFVGTLEWGYRVHSAFGDGSVAVVSVRVTSDIPLPNQPPTASFMMRNGSQTAMSGSILTVVADPATGEGRVLFTESASDLDGRVASWIWSVDTEPAPIAVGDAAFEWGFRPGRYTVILTATDDDRASSSASGIVEVLPSASTLVHSDPDPNVFYGRPLVDDDGVLYVPRSVSGASCPFGICETGIQKIGPAGGVWLRGPIAPDPFAPLGLAFAPDGRVYFQGLRSTLFSFNAAGEATPGWPVRITDAPNPSLRAMLIDDDTGQVHLAARSAFLADAPVNVTLNADGTEAWRLPDADGGDMFRGPSGDLYVRATDIARFDRATGAERCRTLPDAFQSLSPQAFTVGTPEGVMGSFYSDVFRLGGDCRVSTVYSWVGSYFVTAGYSPAGPRGQSRLIGVGFGGTFAQPTDPVLVGLTMSGALAWRRDDIAPENSAIIEVRDGVVYLFGADRSDGLRRKLFAVDALTGDVNFRADVTDVCSFGCNVGVGPGGRAFITDANRVYRVR